MWWSVAIVVLLVIGLAVGLSVGLFYARGSTPTPEPSPVPTPTPATPTPSATDTTKVLFQDMFDGVASLPLSAHTPTGPVGAGWLAAPTYSSAELELDGSGAAINAVDINAPTNPSIYQGANITSGTLTAAGYVPSTDTLSYTITFEVPTITPDSKADDGMIFLTALSRTNPQVDFFMIQLTYLIGNGAAPTYQFIARTIFDNGGPGSNEQQIVNTGIVAGHPPLDTPITATFTIHPDGQCHVTCPLLSVDSTGPVTPDLVPRNGAVMDYFWTFVQSAEDAASTPTLYAKLQDVLVTATTPVTSTRTTPRGPPVRTRTSNTPNQNILEAILKRRN